MDNNRLILTVDKGVALVVIDKAKYIKKAEDLLKEKNIQEDHGRPYCQAEKQAHKHTEKHQDRGRHE